VKLLVEELLHAHQAHLSEVFPTTLKKRVVEILGPEHDMDTVCQALPDHTQALLSL
jgi:hypothetical protein